MHYLFNKCTYMLLYAFFTVKLLPVYYCRMIWGVMRQTLCERYHDDNLAKVAAPYPLPNGAYPHVCSKCGCMKFYRDGKLLRDF